jgi:dipeptidyl aminopeptidase/acylaminoacyl peptidase
VVLLALVALTVVLVPVVAGFLTTYVLLYAPCGADDTTPRDFGDSWEDVTFRARSGDSVRAFFIPGANGATIIIPPTTRDGRGNRLHLAHLFRQHGYAVLTFDSRRCADMGPLSLGYKEADDIGDALAYLIGREDVDRNRIGVSGFSSAGAAAMMAAARYSDLRAVIAEGGYGDFAEGAVGIGQDRGTILEKIYKWSIGTSYRLITGLDIDLLSPLDVAAQIRPRPILLIYGSIEGSLAGARLQQAAAGDNADLWVVEGAGHGGYLAVAPQEYEQRVIAFFDRALLDAKE